MGNSKKMMIFHVPFKLDDKATSASGIRPVKMRMAFEHIGYEVIEISGTHAQRKTQIKNVKKRIRAGLKAEFVYTEAATVPTGLGEPISLKTSFLRDINFLKFCRKNKIPVGLFYRDVYWQFEEYEKRVGKFFSLALRSLYKFDLHRYNKALNLIYLPSMEMAPYMPTRLQSRARELPPGLDTSGDENLSMASPINVFYVGGLNNYYRMHETVRGVAESKDAKLTICTRREEWDAAKSSYETLLQGSTEVVHLTGLDLEPIYSKIHIGSLLMEPIEYREFAAPMKLYEYLGHGKAIIATEGSLAAKFISENDIGWVLPYEAAALSGLLDKLLKKPEELAAKMQNAVFVRSKHTWSSRAKTVANQLTKVDSGIVNGE